MRHWTAAKRLHDREGRPVLPLDRHHTLRWFQEKHPDVELAETAD